MNLNDKENLEHVNFAKSIKTNDNNLINSNNNTLYPYDSFRPGNLIFNNNSNPNSSITPNNYFTSKDFFKIVKRSNIMNEKEFNNFLDGKSKSSFKINDLERKNEEIRKCKQDFNDKIKEIHAVKIAFFKLDQENKRNVKIIEDMIVETAKHKVGQEIFSFPPEDYYEELKNTLIFGKTSDRLLSKLIESHAINNLKRQIFEFKQSIAKQEEEISKLKNNSRFAKFHDLENKLRINIEEITNIKEDYTNLKNSFKEKESDLKSVLEERENYKKLYNGSKVKYEDVKNKINELEKLNFLLQDKLKKLEEINSNNKYTHISFTKQIKDRDLEIYELKEKLRGLENFKNEKESLQKTLLNLNKNLNILKEEMEKKNQLIKSLQRLNNELKGLKKLNNGCSIEPIDEKSNLTWSNMPIPWKIVIKEKDKKILELEKEINKLNNLIEKLNREMHSFKTGSVCKIKINCLPLGNSNINNNINTNIQGVSQEKFFISSHEVVRNNVNEKSKVTLLNHKLNKIRNNNSQEKKNIHKELSSELNDYDPNHIINQNEGISSYQKDLSSQNLQDLELKNILFNRESEKEIINPSTIASNNNLKNDYNFNEVVSENLNQENKYLEKNLPKDNKTEEFSNILSTETELNKKEKKENKIIKDKKEKKEKMETNLKMKERQEQSDKLLDNNNYYYDVNHNIHSRRHLVNNLYNPDDDNNYNLNENFISEDYYENIMRNDLINQERSGIRDRRIERNLNSKKAFEGDNYRNIYYNNANDNNNNFLKENEEKLIGQDRIGYEFEQTGANNKKTKKNKKQNENENLREKRDQDNWENKIQSQTDQNLLNEKQNMGLNNLTENYDDIKKRFDNNQKEIYQQEDMFKDKISNKRDKSEENIRRNYYANENINEIHFEESEGKKNFIMQEKNHNNYDFNSHPIYSEKNSDNEKSEKISENSDNFVKKQKGKVKQNEKNKFDKDANLIDRNRLNQQRDASNSILAINLKRKQYLLNDVSHSEEKNNDNIKIGNYEEVLYFKNNQIGQEEQQEELENYEKYGSFNGKYNNNQKIASNIETLNENFDEESKKIYHDGEVLVKDKNGEEVEEKNNMIELTLGEKTINVENNDEEKYNDGDFRDYGHADE